MVNMNAFRPGTKVRIIRCAENPMLIGKIATVMENQDCHDKIRVSFSDRWQGYFKPSQIAVEVMPENLLFEKLGLSQAFKRHAKILAPKEIEKDIVEYEIINELALAKSAVRQIERESEMRDIKSMIDELSEKEKAAPLSSYDKGFVTGLRIAYLLQNPRIPAAERYKLRLYQREDDIATAPEMHEILDQLTRIGGGVTGLIRLTRLQSEAQFSRKPEVKNDERPPRNHRSAVSYVQGGFRP